MKEMATIRRTIAIPAAAALILILKLAPIDNCFAKLVPLTATSRNLTWGCVPRYLKGARNDGRAFS
jgi:hypothetical protein